MRGHGNSTRPAQRWRRRAPRDRRMAMPSQDVWQSRQVPVYNQGDHNQTAPGGPAQVQSPLRRTQPGSKGRIAMDSSPGLDTSAASHDPDDHVARTIFRIVAGERKLDPASLTLDSRLEELDIESVDLVEIIFAIEDEFDIDIPQDKDDFKLETMRDIVDGVRSLIAARDAQTS